MKKFKVKIPIFKLSIVVCHSCSIEKSREFFLKYGVQVGDYGKYNKGYVINHDGDIYMFIADPENNASTVFHEITHAAFSICQLKGMAIDEELIAYLVGYLKLKIADQVFHNYQGEEE